MTVTKQRNERKFQNGTSMMKQSDTALKQLKKRSSINCLEWKSLMTTVIAISCQKSLLPAGSSEKVFETLSGAAVM